MFNIARSRGGYIVITQKPSGRLENIAINLR